MKHVAAGAHLPTPWLFEPAKRPDDRADYSILYCQYTIIVIQGEERNFHIFGDEIHGYEVNK